MRIVAAIAFVLLVVATAIMAERRAGLPPAALPAKRKMFTAAILGALGMGGLGYSLLTGGPAWQIAASAVLAVGGFLGILLSARAMLRVLKGKST